MHPREAKRPAASSFLLILLGVLIAVAWVYGQFFLSGTRLIAGDTVDSRGLIATLEHWRNVLRYGVSIRSEPFFYPDTGVMGYNEALLLYVPFYVIFRLLGADGFVAFEGVLICMTAMAAAAMHLLLNRGFGFRPWISFCGSLLFACSSMTYLVVAHGALISVALLPVTLGLATAAIRARGTARSPVLMALAGLLLGLEAATCYYICWSIVFLAGLFAAILLVLLAIFDRAALRALAGSAASFWREIAAGAVGMALGLIPFFYIYLPVYRRFGGGHPVEAAYPYMLDWRDFINVGAGNILWGGVVQRFCHYSVEMWFGWPPVLILAACLAGAAALRRLRSGALRGAPWSDRFFCASVASGVLTWLIGFCLFAKIGPLRLWALVHRFVPGAAGLRVPQRADLVSNFFVCLAAAFFLNGASAWLRKLRPAASGALIAGIGVFLLVEQVDIAPRHELDRFAEIARINRIQPPPPGCRVFYISRPAYAGETTYAAQLDAVFAAVRFRLPTVNGRGTVEPDDWNIEDPAEYYYESRAAARAFRTPLSGDLCALDLETGAWTRPDVLNPAHKPFYRLGSTVDFRAGGNGYAYETYGWSAPEPGGTWMVGRQSSLQLFLDASPQRGMVLVVSGEPYSPPGDRRRSIEILVNGARVSSTTAVGPTRIVAGIDRRLLPAGMRLQIDFRTPDDLLTPRQYGPSPDSRHLNFQLRTLRIRDASDPSAPEAGCSVAFQGWYDIERSGAQSWRWSSGAGELHIFVSQDRDLTLEGAIVSLQPPNTIDFLLDGVPKSQIQTTSAAPAPLPKMLLHLTKGEHVIAFQSKNPGVRIGSDTRLLAIALHDLNVQTPGGCELQ